MTIRILDWDAAKTHLDELQQQYTEIGAAGIPALTLAMFGPRYFGLRYFYERGERTQGLHVAIMGLE